MALPSIPEPVAAKSGSYQSLLELGRGGMGTVYVARTLGAGGFERLVVLKRLHSHLTDLPEAVRRFLDEACVAAYVRHSNVVSTLQVGSDADGYYLVLDYVEGASLENLLDYAAIKQELLPVPIMLRIALDALAGLEAVHQAEDPLGRPLKILHRDVTLQNVLIGRDGVTRIADFGIAKSALGSVTTDKSYVVGKLLYLPPEYLRREPNGPSLDVYSLGITLWLALSGRELWTGASEAQLLKHILHDHVPRLSSVMTIAPQLESVIATACQPLAEMRFQSAAEMARAIEAIGRETGWIATHGEVAELVDRHAGVDLRRRRELIARALERADEMAPISQRSSPDEPPPVRRREYRSKRARDAQDSSVRRKQPAPEAVNEPVETSDARVPGERHLLAPLLIGCGVLAAFGIAAALLWPRASAPTEPDPAPQNSEGVTPPPAPGPALSPPSPTLASPLPSSAEPASSAARPTDRTVQHARRPTEAARTSATASSEPPRPSAEPERGVLKPVKPPEEVSKRNPYRDP